jgi:hypothetical protein
MLTFSRGETGSIIVSTVAAGLGLAVVAGVGLALGVSAGRTVGVGVAVDAEG